MPLCWFCHEAAQIVYFIILGCNLFLLNGLLIQRGNSGQICASCSGIETREVCDHFIKCSDGEECYMHSYTTESGEELSDLGCTVSQGCPHSVESVFGKRAEGHRLKCFACCNKTALCNENLSCDGNLNAGITLPKDCSELIVPSHHSGTYTIYPYGVQHLPVSVQCVFDSDGAWTVFQRRFDGSVNFYRGWEAYKKGFGTSNGEYWLGNDIIYNMTNQGNHELKIVLMDFANVTKYAKYSSFHISEEAHGYRLSVMGYSGTAGDDMHVHEGMKWSTFDRDNDLSPSASCATLYKGTYEPRHDKTNKMSVRPAKTQISLGICPVWPESSQCAQWVAEDPSFLHADSEDSDQTGRMPRLIWVFSGRTAILLVVSCRGSHVL